MEVLESPNVKTWHRRLILEVEGGLLLLKWCSFQVIFEKLPYVFMCVCMDGWMVS